MPIISTVRTTTAIPCIPIHLPGMHDAHLRFMYRVLDAVLDIHRNLTFASDVVWPVLSWRLTTPCPRWMVHAGWGFVTWAPARVVESDGSWLATSSRRLAWLGSSLSSGLHFRTAQQALSDTKTGLLGEKNCLKLTANAKIELCGHAQGGLPYITWIDR